MTLINLVIHSEVDSISFSIEFLPKINGSYVYGKSSNFSTVFLKRTQIDFVSNLENLK